MLEKRAMLWGGLTPKQTVAMRRALMISRRRGLTSLQTRRLVDKAVKDAS